MSGDDSDDETARKAKAAAYQREWAAKNRERVRKAGRVASAKYSAAHPERRLESSRAYDARQRALDPEGYRQKRNAAGRQAYASRIATDPEYLARKLASNARWSAENVERAKVQRQAAQEKWRLAHPEVGRDLRRRKSAEVLTFFGGACVRCGFAEAGALHVDHIHGGGGVDRRKGAGTVYEQHRLIHNDPDAARAKYQLLCAICHALKE